MLNDVTEQMPYLHHQARVGTRIYQGESLIIMVSPGTRVEGREMLISAAGLTREPTALEVNRVIRELWPENLPYHPARFSPIDPYMVLIEEDRRA